MKILIAILIVVAVVVIFMLVRKQNPVVNQQVATHRKSTDGTSKPLLKQFGNLTLSDFVQHPVWVNCHVIAYGKPWYNETDEETFRPWDGNIPADPGETMFLVKGQLILADGTEYDGFITPQQGPSEPDLSIIQPYLFAKSEKALSFWFGMFEPSRKEINRFYETFGKNAEQVFPIRFRAVDGLAKGIVEGTIPGFCRKGKNNEIIVEK
jgi:hypothetical protein